MEMKNLASEDLFWLTKESIDSRVKKEALKEMLSRANCPIKYVWEVFIDKRSDEEIKEEAAVWFKKDGTAKFLVLQYLNMVTKNKKKYFELVNQKTFNEI